MNNDNEKDEQKIINFIFNEKQIVRFKSLFDILKNLSNEFIIVFMNNEMHIKALENSKTAFLNAKITIDNFELYECFQENFKICIDIETFNEIIDFITIEQKLQMYILKNKISKLYIISGPFDTDIALINVNDNNIKQIKDFDLSLTTTKEDICKLIKGFSKISDIIEFQYKNHYLYINGNNERVNARHKIKIDVKQCNEKFIDEKLLLHSYIIKTIESIFKYKIDTKIKFKYSNSKKVLNIGYRIFDSGHINFYLMAVNS